MTITAKLFIFLTFTIFTSGCGLMQRVYENSTKISKDIFQLKNYRYDINVVSDRIINKSANYNKNTIKLVIFQLKQDSLFNQANYYDLLVNPNSILGDDVISQDSDIIYSFSTKNIIHNLDSKTKFLGLVFFFNQPEYLSSWKIIIPVENLNLFKSSYILVTASSAKVMKKKDVVNLIKLQKQELKNSKSMQKSNISL